MKVIGTMCIYADVDYNLSLNTLDVIVMETERRRANGKRLTDRLRKFFDTKHSKALL